MRRVIMPIVFLLTVFISCEQDNYEKGEGRYSLMRGDFAELRIDADLRATTIVTDDLERLSLKEPYTAKWIARPDTTYRHLFFYHLPEVIWNPCTDWYLSHLYNPACCSASGLRV